MKKLLVLLFALVPLTLLSAPASGASCLKINKWYPTQVLQGNESGTGKLQFVSAAAVKSPDFKNVFFVAVKFKAQGVGNQVGVWAINGKLPQKAADLSGLTLSANAIAQQFTVWPDGNKTQAQIAINDPSISAAIKCLKK